MKLIDIVAYEQMSNVEIIKKLIIKTSCPNNFGFDDDLESCKNNDKKGCSDCWNREV